jgi:hypothetical protein
MVRVATLGQVGGIQCRWEGKEKRCRATLNLSFLWLGIVGSHAPLIIFQEPALDKFSYSSHKTSRTGITFWYVTTFRRGKVIRGGNSSLWCEGPEMR